MLYCFLCCIVVDSFVQFFFVKQKTAYEMRISDWSSDVCSSDLRQIPHQERGKLVATGWEHVAVGVALFNVALVKIEVLFTEAWLGGGHDQVGVALEEIGRASCRERVCQYV